MKPTGPTPFQLRVYEAVCRIPHGRVATYSAVAAAVQCGSARVVGQALRQCRDPDVPCHRVVAAGGAIGGFGGTSAGPDVERKRRLLEAEGIRFARDGRIEADQVLEDNPGSLRLLGGRDEC